MDSAGASPSLFESKKVLRLKVNKPDSSGESLETPDRNPWSANTPEKPAQPPQRGLTRRQSLRSVNQIREAAKQLRKSDLKRILTPSPSPVTLRSSATVISRHYSGNVSKKVEDVMPIATGHEREELEAEL